MSASARVESRHPRRLVRLLFGLSLLGCTAASAAPGTAGESPLPPPDPEGLSHFLEFPGHPRGAEKIVLPPGSVLEATFGIASGEAKPLPLRLVCFLDLRQVPCAPAGSPTGVPAIAVPPGAVWSRHRIEIAPTAAGRHELILALFLLPDLHLESAEFRRDTTFMFEFQRRIVVWGEERPAERPDGLQPVGAPDDLARRGARQFSLSPDAKPDSRWPPRVQPGAPFFVRLNNADPEGVLDIGLVALLDYEQVPLDGDEPFALLRVRPLSAADVTGRLPGDVSPGPHEFLVIAVESPLRDPDLAEYDEVHSSRRVLVVAP